MGRGKTPEWTPGLVYSFERKAFVGVPRKKRHRCKTTPRQRTGGLQLAWLDQHRDHAGDDCLPFLYRKARPTRVSYNFKPRPVVVVMCLMAHGAPPSGKTMALHRCGNGHLECVNPRHLYWGDVSDNQADAARHKREGRPFCPDTLMEAVMRIAG